jgi:GntR family transcriptional regulator
VKEHTLEPACRLGGAVMSDRIVSNLLEELREGRFSKIDHLPAEVELAGQLGVSRTVIRDALSELEREGYIERVRGIGTVVNRHVLSLRSRIDQKLEYYPLIRNFGSYPHADGIQIQALGADHDLAASLELSQGEEVVCIRKRILADTRPVIYSIDYLPRSLFGTRDFNRLDLTPSVFDVLERECGQQPASNVAHIKASCGDDSIRAAMRLAPGEAMLLLDEVCYNRLCKPIMRSYSYYTNFFDFSILRKML